MYSVVQFIASLSFHPSTVSGAERISIVTVAKIRWDSRLVFSLSIHYQGKGVRARDILSSSVGGMFY